jgi:hypothetical protein
MKTDLRFRRRMKTNPRKFTNGCIGKLKYPSKRNAKANRKRIIDSSETEAQYWDAVGLQIYKCMCNSWHLGHGRRRNG